MNKILIGGAGGAPSEGVICSLLQSEDKEEIIGVGSEPFDLAISSASRKYLVPYADSLTYKDKLLRIIKKEKPDMVHFQNDLEVYHVSLIRDDIQALGTKVFMPKHEVIDTCVNKWKSWKAFYKAGLTVPMNQLIYSPEDLKKAFSDLGDLEGKIWLRANEIGGGGIGSIPTDDFEMAKAWIDRYNGWGNYIAAQMLTENTVTWLSIWWHGELVVAQTRKRTGWAYGNRAVSGVTGVTKVGITYSDEQVSNIAIKAIKAVDEMPHGIFGVDMAYDRKGVPNPTEINISRFFTTVLFFTTAGLNMPVIYKNLALYNRFPKLDKKINPLPDGLIWLRAMDRKPMLTTLEELNNMINT